MTTKFHYFRLALVLLFFSAIDSQLFTAQAQGTAFTYQGRLNDGLNPADGSYDFRFRLASDPLANNYIGGNILTNGVPVSKGLFMVALDFGAGVFTGSNYWLEVDVRTNGAASYVVLSPLQSVTPAPYAIMANSASNLLGALPAAQLIGPIGNGNLPASPTFSGNITASGFAGNGVGVSNVNATALSGLNATNFWQLGGNIVAGGQYLGSLNYQPVEIWAGGARALRIEPGTNFIPQGYPPIPNIIGGSPGNFVDPTSVGNTISGGGEYSEGVPNSITHGNYNFIGGGTDNHITNGFHNSISGGTANMVGSPSDGTVGGGNNNTVNGTYSTIGGGAINTIGVNTLSDTIGGGFDNTISSNSNDGVIAGGSYSSIGSNSYYATIAGGTQNKIGSNSFNAAIGGGTYNIAIGTSSTVDGGEQNQATAFRDTVAGGYQNVAGGGISTVAGGWTNVASGNSGAIGGGDHNVASNTCSTVGGGNHNAAGAVNATIGGGVDNVASGYAATIGGGGYNLASNIWAVVGGGFTNFAGGSESVVGGGLYNVASGDTATVGGGYQNVASGPGAVVGGGGYDGSVGGPDVASGVASTVPGGFNNLASGKYSFAAGQRGKATNDGAFVWADSQNADFSSTNNDSFNIRARGGVRFVTGGAGVAVDGATVVMNNNFTPVTVNGTFNGNGAGVSNVAALTLGGQYPTNFWQLSGNNVSASQFFGSTNNQAVNFLVNGVRALRLEPNPNPQMNYSNIVNVIGGSPVNFVAPGISGAFIGGGGSPRYMGQGYTNSVTADFGAVVGGNGNSSGYFGFTGGGGQNSAGYYGVVGGGVGNTETGSYDVIPGGFACQANGYSAFASGWYAQALHEGTFVWSDTQAATFSSNTNNEFSIRAQNGVRIQTDRGIHLNNADEPMIVRDWDVFTTNAPASKAGIGRWGLFQEPQRLTLGIPDNVTAWYQVAKYSTNGNYTTLMQVDQSGAVSSSGGFRLNDKPIYLRTGTDANHGLAYSGSGVTNFAPTVLPDGPVLWGFAGGVLGMMNGGARAILTWSNNAVAVNGSVYANGVQLTSDRNAKENFTALDARSVLEKVVSLPLSQWNYKSEDASQKHIGPMAQDFHSAFGLDGADDKHISVVDEGGVALAAIQGLNQKLTEKESEIQKLQTRNDTLEKRLNALEARLGTVGTVK
jgi:hypothetical protein